MAVHVPLPTIVADHGRLTSQATTTAATAPPRNSSAGRQAPPPSSVPSARRTPPTDDDDGERRHERDRHRDDEGQLGEEAHPAPQRQVDLALVLGGAGEAGRVDPRRPAQQVDDPRRRGVAGQRAPPTDRQQLARQRHRGVDDQGDDARPRLGEQRRQRPHPGVADDEQPEHGDGVPQAHVEQGHDAAAGDERQARGRGDGGAEAVRRPAGAERGEQVGGAVRVRHDLAERRHAAGDQPARGDDGGGQDDQPGDRRGAAGGLPPPPLGGVVGIERAAVARAQVRGQPGAAAHLQAGDLGGRDVAQAGDLPPPGDDRRDPRHQAEHRPDRRQRLPRPRRHDADDELGQRDEEQLDQHPRQASGAGQRGDRAHPVPGLHRDVAQVGSPLLELLAVAGAGAGHDHHARSAEVGPPAQLDVVAVEAQCRVEAAQAAEQVGADQQAGRRQGEHVTHRVVLLLVDLARLDERIDLAEAVDAEADVLEAAGVAPLDQLRADDAGVGAVQLLDQQPDRRRVERDVVVQEAEEAVVALDEVEHLVGRRAVARIPVDGADERVGQPPADLLVDRPRVARYEEQVAQGRVVLAGQTVEHLGEPGARFVHHDDRHDGRGGLLGIHDRARLAAGSDEPPSPVSPGCLQKLALRVTL